MEIADLVLCALRAGRKPFVSSWLAEIRSGFAQLSPSVFPYRGFGLALVIGIAGGWLFYKLRLPLPWMLGAMIFCTVAALARLPVAAPAVIRSPMSAIIGVMLGSGFSPAIISQVPQWIVPLGGLVLFMLACGLSVVWYFRKVGGYDWVTAFFSGMPGGLVEMVIYGEERGGDARIIALVHSTRILMVVMTLPFLIQWSQGISLDRAGGSGASMFATPLLAELWLVALGFAGAFLGHILRLPAKTLLGCMIVSAAVHITGVSDFKPPFEIVNAAQLVLGVAIGCRFAGTASGVLWKVLMLSVGSTAILIFWMTLFAVAVSHISGFSVVTLILAYSPGGLTEMAIIAVALNAEVAFVAAFHIIRVFLTMIAAPLAFGWLGKGGKT
jgi:membrane AbrB-like protein